MDGRVITELNGSGSQQRRYVLIGAQELMRGGEWMHENPVTGSQRRTVSTGTIRAQGSVELDPLGNDVSLSDPYLAAQQQTDQPYPRFGNPANQFGGCVNNGDPISCTILEELIHSGVVRVSSATYLNNPRNPNGHFQHGTYQHYTQVLVQTSRVIGALPMPGGDRPLVTTFHFTAFVPDFGQRHVGQRPRRQATAPSAKFDMTRFKTCIKTLFKTELAPSDGKTQGFDSPGGTFTGFFGSSKIPFTIRLDDTSKTVSQIRQETKSSTAIAMSDYNDQWLVYLGSDAFKNTVPEYRIATEVHEIGNKLYDEFAKDGLPKPRALSNLLFKHDNDAGMALEECVFGGFVNPNGAVIH
jgi:hypothetical protein